MLLIIIVLYQLLLLLVTPVALLFWAYRALSSERYKKGWSERLGIWGAIPTGAVWLHGASVGEMRAAGPLIKEIEKLGAPLLLTTTTATGRDVATGLAGEGGFARLLPIDLIFILLPIFKRLKPAVLILVETELWPGLIWVARMTGTPVVMVSGRISDRSYPRYRKIKFLLGDILRLIDHIQTQNKLSAERLLSLGADEDRLEVGGDLKSDIAGPDHADPVKSALAKVRDSGWHVLVAGSVHPGEASEIAEAAVMLKESDARAALVLAPRHLEKLAEIEGEVTAKGLKVSRWSELESPSPQEISRIFERGEVLLVDRYGLLTNLYGGATIAFVGGSMVNVGGHNLLEPLNWGVPVLFGHNMQNTPDMRDEALTRGLGFIVGDGEALARRVAHLLDHPEELGRIKVGALEFLESNRGATGRAMTMLEQFGLRIETERDGV